jgi:DNA repair exonuclease SbcCD ATPase subunit
MYDYIIHLSDIHIRLKNREDEYRQVFTRLYERIDIIINDSNNLVDSGSEDIGGWSLRKTPNNLNKSKEGLIVVTGDIFHDKVSLTPESIILCTEFFTNLAQRLKTIIIPGNHDGLLNSNERIDNISGVLFGKEISNLYYFKNSGIHQFDNIIFGISSIFDNIFIKSCELDNFIVNNQIQSQSKSSLIKIGLYHGMVGNVKLQNMCEAKGEKTVEDFNGYDYVLLGDIHTHQFLNDAKTIAYPSSLISQNFSETDAEHGFIYWDLYNNENTHYEIIKNDYHHKTAYLDKNILIIDNISYDINEKETFNYLKENIIPPYGKIKIMIENEETDNNIDFYKYLKDQFKTVSWSYTNNVLINKGKADKTKKNQINEIKIDIKDIIKDILQDDIKKEKINQNTIDYIYNDLKNRKNSKDKKGNNWKLLKVTISNLCLYNELNTIDFSKLTSEEITLIYGQNNVGKSSLIDIISSILYNKIARKINNGNKRIQEILNINKKDGHGEILFQIEEKLFLVQRFYKRKKNREIKSEAFLYKLSEIMEDQDQNQNEEIYNFDLYEYNNKKFKLNLKTKNSTVTTDIEELLGNHDDFIFMNIMLQFDNISFRNMKQSCRKELLNRLLELDIYEEIREDIVPEYEKYNEEYKILKRKIDAVDIKGLMENQLLNKQLFNNILQKIDDIEERKIELNGKIDNLNKKYIIVDPKFDKNIDLTLLENKLKVLNDSLNNLGTIQLNVDKVKKESIQNKIIELNNIIYEKHSFKKNFYDIKETEECLNQKLETKNKQLKNIEATEEKYKKLLHQYEKITKEYQEQYQISTNSINEISYKLRGLTIDSRSINSSTTKESLQTEIDIHNNNLQELEREYNLIQSEISELNISIKKEDQSNLLKNYENYEVTLLKKSSLENEYYSKNHIIKELENHEYNKKCKYCLKHAKVVEFQKLQEEVIILNDNLLKINSDLENNNSKKRKEEYDNQKTKLNDLYNNSEKYRVKIDKLTNLLKITQNKYEFITLTENKEIIYNKWNNNPIINQKNIIYEEKDNSEKIIINKEKVIIEIRELEKNIELYNLNKINKIHNEEIEYEIIILKNELDKLKEEETIMNKEYENYIEKTEQLVKINNTISELNSKIERTKELTKIINDNKIITEELDLLNQESKEKESEYKKLEHEKFKLEENINSTDKIINNYDTNKKDYISTLNNYELYNNYLKVLHKNGLSLKILKEYLSHISDGINVIIEQFINKKIELYIEKDDIVLDIKVKDTNKNEYNIMMLGGRESFMMDISFKIVLSNIANLPRSNFLFIDEGISVLDKENLSNINELFVYLNNYYEHVFLISHVEGVKDFVNNIINIKTINGYSRILQ